MTEEELLACKNGMYDACYSQAVNREIRKKYSLSQELAILRQKEEKPQEFAAYHADAQAAKAQVKAAFALALSDAGIAVNGEKDASADSSDASLA